MIIRDASTGEVVAAGNYNETNLIVFSEWLVEWLTTFDNLTLVPERKSSAVAIIDNLLKLTPLKYRSIQTYSIGLLMMLEIIKHTTKKLLEFRSIDAMMKYM